MKYTCNVTVKWNVLSFVGIFRSLKNNLSCEYIFLQKTFFLFFFCKILCFLSAHLYVIELFSYKTLTFHYKLVIEQNINSFQVNVLFLYTLKTSGNLLFSDIFRGYTNQTLAWNSRSSHPELFCQKGVLKNFKKFTGKWLCRVSLK